MRLLRRDHDGGFSLTSFSLDAAPKYGILSHIWLADSQEVTYEDIRNHTGKQKEGFVKLDFCANRAAHDGLDYFWIDTCCIDKSSSAELSEAINSMYSWYHCSEKCYVLMMDVSGQPNQSTGSEWIAAFRRSQWHKRGWTLQELLAPRCVEFWARNETLLGDKVSLEHEIYQITRIPTKALWSSASLKTFSFGRKLTWMQDRKTKLPEDQAYCLMGILDVSMPVIYGEGKEKALRRLKDEADKLRHRLYEMEDTTQDKILGEFKGPERQRLILASLKLDSFDDRRREIKSAQEGTCSWLLNHKNYTSWINPQKGEEHHRFLWIKGKPGAGKSTVMKFALQHADDEKQENDLIISFFFNARGVESEKSTRGMWSSLLYQIFSKADDLQYILDTVEFPSQHDPAAPPWTVDLLCWTFTAVVRRLKRRRLRCFIDALDECEEFQIRAMIEFFEELGHKCLQSRIGLYVCFASRHYPTISIEYGLQIVLEAQRGHDKDLAQYVRTHLKVGRPNTSWSHAAEKVRLEVQQKANGIFMWAVLVIPLLNAEFDRGRIFAVRKKLQELRPELSDLFRQIIGRDNVHMDDLLLSCQWILFAAHPLTKEEYYFAMTAGLRGDVADTMDWDLALATEDDMSHYVSSSSKGLAVLTTSDSADKAARTVQFIHESVRDFLLKDGGSRHLTAETGDGFIVGSHDRLRQCCYNFLGLAEHASLPQPHLPFLAYACENVLYHAESSATRLRADEFPRNFPLKSWIDAKNRFSRVAQPRDVKLLYVLAENNCVALIKAMCRDGPLIGEEGGHYCYPLFAAIATRNEETVKALLQHKGPLTRKFQVELGYGARPRQARHSTHPLIWAMRGGFHDVAERLVNARDLDLDKITSEGRDVLSVAVETGCEPVFEWIVRKGYLGGMANKTDHSRNTPLAYAVQSGRVSMAEGLIDSGAAVDVARPGDVDMLLLAASSGHENTLRILLDNGASVTTTDRAGWTALHKAVWRDHESAVRLLLKRGAEVCAVETWGRTPLHYSRSVGITQSLLDYGADVEALDNAGKTALHTMVGFGFVHCVDFLLDQGAAIDTKDGNGMTPLLRATMQGQFSCVRTLLLRGADIEAVDDNGMTALHRAATANCRDLVELLIYRRANINAEDNGGMAALSKAAARGDTDCVRLLLDQGAHIESSDIDGMTALLHAAAQGRRKCAKLLVDAGANTAVKNALGKELSDFLPESKSWVLSARRLARTQRWIEETPFDLRPS